MKKQSLTKFLALSLILILVAGCAGSGKTEKEKKPIPNLPESKTQSEGSTQKGSTAGAEREIDAKTAYEKLSSYAKNEWAFDAVLLELTAPYRFVDSINKGSCVSWTSVFYSPSKKQTWFFHYYDGQLYKAGKPNYENVDLAFVDSAKFANSPEVFEQATSNGMATVKKISLVAGLTNPYAKVPPEVGTLKLYWLAENDKGNSLFFDGVSLKKLK